MTGEMRGWKEMLRKRKLLVTGVPSEDEGSVVAVAAMVAWG